MWDTDEKRDKLIAVLKERLSGSDYDVEDLAEYTNNLEALVEEASKPWYALIDVGAEIDIFVHPTKDELTDFIMDEYPPHEVEYIEIYHDGKKVYWEVELVVED